MQKVEHACVECKKAHTKCSEIRPCPRCKKLNLPCTQRTSQRFANFSTFASSTRYSKLQGNIQTKQPNYSQTKIKNDPVLPTSIQSQTNILDPSYLLPITCQLSDLCSQK